MPEQARPRASLSNGGEAAVRSERGSPHEPSPGDRSLGPLVLWIATAALVALGGGALADTAAPSSTAAGALDAPPPHAYAHDAEDPRLTAPLEGPVLESTGPRSTTSTGVQGPDAAAGGPLSQTGSYTVTKDAYTFDATWEERARMPGDALFEATVTTERGQASVVQELDLTASFLAETDGHTFHVDASTGTGAVPWLRLDYSTAPVQQAPAYVDGFVKFYFHQDVVLHYYGFRVPSTALAPIQETTTRVDWADPYVAHGSVDPEGTVHPGDDGSQLDPYGEWGAQDRYAVYHDEAGALAAHARIAQGANLNYIEDGRFRVDADSSEAVSVFNAFLDSVQGDQWWALDALILGQDATAEDVHDRFEAVEVPWGMETEPSADPSQHPVVVGVPDSGINPYHEAFHRPSLTEHPCTYIQSFPCDIPALNLSIGEHASYEDALAADEEVWDSVEEGTWYWIPETPFVAVYCEEPYSAGHRCILDEHRGGHGTGSTSSVISEHPEALIAFKEGSGSTIEPLRDKGIPVDVYSVSWANVAPLPGHPDVFCANHETAPIFVTAAGNDPRSTLVDCRKGSPSLITVGGAYAKDDTEEALATKQPEVVSYFCRPTAEPDSLDQTKGGYCGTSFSAPTVAGALSKVVRAIRVDSGYTGTIQDGLVDPVADVSRTDLRDAMNRTASYDPDPQYKNQRATGLPLSDLAPWVQWGWGFYDGTVAEATIDHLLGVDEADPKPEDARDYMDAQHTAKDTLYGDLS